MPDQPKPFVRVTPRGPEDGGDFGPNTAATRTAGIAEAIAYAHEHLLDVFIHGGRGGYHAGHGVPVTYPLQETLHIPWAQDFRLDGTNYTMAYGGPGPVIQIDSQMNCKYRFGMVLGSGNSGEPSVLIKPSKTGPDDMAVIVASEFDFAAVCGYDSIVLDASVAGIANCTFYAEETNSQRYGLHLKEDGTGHGMHHNTFDIPYTNQYDAPRNATAFRIGDPGCARVEFNTFVSANGAPRGVTYDAESGKYSSPEGDDPAEKAIGLDVFGVANRFEMAFSGVRFPGMDVVFEPEARDNAVHAFNLPNGFTNRAKMPTNRILPYSQVGFDVETPDFPRSGEVLTSRSAYLVEAFILTAGDVAEWSIRDSRGAERTFKGGLSAGQSFLLEPGDQVCFNYLSKNSHGVPSWSWKAIR